MRELTQKEAEEIFGAAGVPGAIAGGIYGGAGYIGGVTGGGNFKTTEFIASVGSGALLGAMGPAASLLRTGANTVGSFGTGVILGNTGRLGGGS